MLSMRRITAALASGIVLLACLSEPALADGASRRPPNVLFILTDDQQPDTIAALGNPVIKTPHMDSLVRAGTTFVGALSPNPLCVPARAEIMTGICGLRGGQIDTRIEGKRLWAETMREAGYHTWYVGKWHNDGRPITRGYEQSLALYAGGGGRFPLNFPVDYAGREVTGYRGWLLQDDDGQRFPELGVGLTPDISERFADAAIELIDRKPERPFFLHLNFTAPHDPLLIPPGWEGRYKPDDIPLPPDFLPEHPFDHGNFDGRDERLLPRPRTPDDVRRDLAAYYAVISHLDGQVGRILDALEATGQAENTLVIFTSDHGLAMGSHGLRGKQNMYDHSVGVPLVIRGPGIRAGVRTRAQCYLRDLFPTVCELCEIAIPEGLDARSLVPVLRGEARAIHPHVFGYFRDVQRMIRTDRWKLIHYPQIGKWQLFDLETDPHEIHNLADDPTHAATLTELRAKLEAWERQRSRLADR
ncbi:MAG: sulfatase-like hydrolase/transferase [Thermoguttaceae bacterium]|jgi:arylsulfatase A-like enzyme|nr:sulfatase-like hydrolase/transferase [Thermoguttaceae bacterium]